MFDSFFSLVFQGGGVTLVLHFLEFEKSIYKISGHAKIHKMFTY